MGVYQSDRLVLMRQVKGKELAMSQRNIKHPKVQCPICGKWIRRLDQHTAQMHPSPPYRGE